MIYYYYFLFLIAFPSTVRPDLDTHYHISKVESLRMEVSYSNLADILADHYRYIFLCLVYSDENHNN